MRSGHGCQVGGVDAGNIKIRTDQGLNILQRKRNRKHAACGHIVKETTAQQDQVDAGLKRQDAGKAGGCVFAHRMPDQCRRAHAPADPQLSKGVFDNHDQRQLYGGLLQAGICCRLVAILCQPNCADVIIQLVLQMVEPPVHPIGKDRFCLIKIAGHACVLSAASREHEDGFWRAVQTVMGEDLAGISLCQQRGRFFGGFRNQSAAFGKTTSPFL